ncbi:zinc ABC transporter substrate-binding protein [Cyanobium sp. Cruz CV13-4-11]|uniref:metal ABC transporter substrate-binding protein n=1 Tax=unclassified Cyanobium TaxID=2627006 RepID=UPI0020CE85F2|nr:MULTISPECIES: metal ABC transporter substrate-binding protein [unclassified Cyanobium]MCP9901886.1 zinc ABC transporter substrate-binding protein [Cyanobium sp. Cruz CV11-17]MCP9920759.1 zinc ABC transporter substrate-binding protein [Cyanobium sp. Cruz CV13-4-11]
MSLLFACLQRTGLLALALVLVGCVAPRQTNDSSSGGKGFKVMTTFLPITLFTRAVAGDCADVTALIPPNTGPHDFQSKPGDLAALREAQVLVKNGLGMEAFLEKLVSSSGNSQLVVIDSSRGIATIDSPEEPGHTEAEHGKEQGHGHAHGEVNPHIWLDPLRAVQQVENIRDGLVKADPSCAEGYRRNAEAFTTQLSALNTELAGQLKPFQGKTFVAFHDFAPYFAERFGLKAEFLVDVPEINPSPADLQRVSEIVERTQLRALLTEPQEGNRSFNALAKDLGVTISVFDPMETASEQASRDPGTYLSVMRRNVADLRQAFGE